MVVSFGVLQGQVFGEMGLFLGARRSLTAVAEDFVELLELGQDGFNELHRDHPQVRHAIQGAGLQAQNPHLLCISTASTAQGQPLWRSSG